MNRKILLLIIILITIPFIVVYKNRKVTPPPITLNPYTTSSTSPAFSYTVKEMDQVNITLNPLVVRQIDSTIDFSQTFKSYCLAGSQLSFTAITEGRVISITRTFTPGTTTTKCLSRFTITGQIPIAESGAYTVKFFVEDKSLGNGAILEAEETVNVTAV